MLDVDLSPIVLLLEAIGIWGVVWLLFLPLDTLSGLFLGPTALLLGEDMLQPTQRWLAVLTFTGLFLFCTRDVLLERRLEHFALNLVVVLKGLIFDCYISVGHCELGLRVYSLYLLLCWWWASGLRGVGNRTTVEHLLELVRELSLRRHWKGILTCIYLTVHSVFCINIDLGSRWRPNLWLHQGSSNTIWNIGRPLLLVGLLKLIRCSWKRILFVGSLSLNKWLLNSIGLLVLKLAHSEIGIVSLRIFTQLLYQIGSLHLYFFSGDHLLGVWILNCHEAIWWRPVRRLFLVAVLESAHACYVYVELHIRRYNKSLLRNILLILCWLKTVKLAIWHRPKSTLEHTHRFLRCVLCYAWRYCFRVNLLATKLFAGLWWVIRKAMSTPHTHTSHLLGVSESVARKSLSLGESSLQRWVGTRFLVGSVRSIWIESPIKDLSLFSYFWIDVSIICSCTLVHFDESLIIFDFILILFIIRIKDFDYCLLCIIVLKPIIPSQNCLQIIFNIWLDWLVTLVGIDWGCSMPHIGFHFLWYKSYSEPEHLMRKIFIKVDIQPLYGPRGRAVIILVDEEYAVPIIAVVFLVILDALYLMLVVVGLCCYLVGQVWVHYSELGVIVFLTLILLYGLRVVFHHRAQSILALEYSSLAIVFVRVPFCAQATVLAIEKLVCECFHEWTALI